MELLVFATHPAMHAFPFLSFSCPHLLPQQSLLFFLLPAYEAFLLCLLCLFLLCSGASAPFHHITFSCLAWIQAVETSETAGRSCPVPAVLLGKLWLEYAQRTPNLCRVWLSDFDCKCMDFYELEFSYRKSKKHILTRHI